MNMPRAWRWIVAGIRVSAWAAAIALTFGLQRLDHPAPMTSLFLFCGTVITTIGWLVLLLRPQAQLRPWVGVTWVGFDLIIMTLLLIHTFGTLSPWVPYLYTLPILVSVTFGGGYGMVSSLLAAASLVVAEWQATGGARDFFSSPIFPLTASALLSLSLIALAASGLGATLIRSERDRLRWGTYATRLHDEVSAAERNRLASEIHAQPLQLALALGYSLEGHAVTSVPPEELLERTTAVIGALRDLLDRLNSEQSQAEPWEDARDCVSDSAQTAQSILPLAPTLLVPDQPIIVPRTVASALRLVVFEALINVAKHAKATEATVSLRRIGRTIEVEIADDGIGMNTAPKPVFHQFTTRRPASSFQGTGMGLAILDQACKHVGGTLAVLPNEPRGTRIVAYFRQRH